MVRSMLWLVLCGCVAEPVVPAPVTASHACDGQVAGRPVHRLTPDELSRTLSVLLGTDFTEVVADAGFPSPASGGGFEGTSDVQSFSELHLDAFGKVAAAVGAAAVQRLDGYETVYDAVALANGEPVIELASIPDTSWWTFVGPRTVTLTPDLTYGGTYEVRVEALWALGWNSLAPSPAVVLPDGTRVGLSGANEPVVAVGRIALPAGESALDVVFDVDEQAGVGVASVTLRGPVDNLGVHDAPARHALLTCQPDLGGEECIDEVIGSWATRAWRRPVLEEEHVSLRVVYDVGLAEGLDEDESLALVVEAVLWSPSFLFVVEETADLNPGDARPANDFELAARMSLLVWGAGPDAGLIECAQQGALTNPGQIGPCRYDVQLQRLLADPAADALVTGFATQWLELNALEGITRDPDIYPVFNQDFIDDAVHETQELLRVWVAQDRDLRDLLTTSETVINDEMADFYGVAHPGGEAWVSVDLTGTDRGGVLRHASVLTAHAHPTRTSPVSRGLFVLDRWLCDPPPPPPPDVGDLSDTGVATVRDELEAHSDDPACRGCHEALDPIGLAFEGFDAMGATVSPTPDVSGVIDGMAFDGPEELLNWLRSDERLAVCLTEELLVWAHRRTLQPVDACAVAHASDAAVEAGFSVASLIEALSQDPGFTHVAAPRSP